MITRINRRTGTNVTELVGNTPLLELPAIAAETPGVRILGKAEWRNPGGSVKDRPAMWMIRDGERNGALTPEKTILDATSGNTGIAYAWIGAALGYKVKLCMPRNASEERKKILRAYGVDFVLTDPGEGSDGAIVEARRGADEGAAGAEARDEVGDLALRLLPDLGRRALVVASRVGRV